MSKELGPSISLKDIRKISAIHQLMARKGVPQVMKPNISIPTFRKIIVAIGFLTEYTGSQNWHHKSVFLSKNQRLATGSG